MSAYRRRWLGFALVVVSLPFLLPQLIPCTDLPQHLAQIRLLDELWGLSPKTLDLSPFTLRPWAANTLVYWPLFLLCHLLPRIFAGKALVWLIVAGSAAALQHLAAVRDRSPAHALMGTIFLFSAPLYWGFLNFLLGLPLWLWFLARALGARDREQPSWRADLGDAALVCLLYGAHIFWVLVAGVATVLFELEDFDLRRTLRRTVVFLPILVPIAIWYPRMVAGRRAAHFMLGPIWDYAGLTPLGGVHGPLEPFAFGLFAAYVLVVLWTARAAISETLDRSLMRLGTLILLFVMLAPYRYMNTVAFNSRFFAVAVMLLLICLPTSASVWPARLAAAGVALFMLGTASVWWRFDRDDLSGLRESLALDAGGKSVLGLDYDRHQPHRRLAVPPYWQSVAYLQALHGGDLGFSFAEHDSSLVVYRQPRPLRWNLHVTYDGWTDVVTTRDLSFFDCALVDGSEADHAKFRAVSGWSTPQIGSYFRLYCR